MKSTVLILMLISLVDLCVAFLSIPGTSVKLCKDARTRLFVGNLFGGVFGGDKKESKGATEIISLPVSNVKIAPLKFFLQIYLVSEQNNPVQGSWVLNNNEENGSLDMYYKDGTGMFAIAIAENSVIFDRYGQRPSLEYMLQESVMIHGVLDEISEIAFGDQEIEQSKRLLQIAEKDILDAARAKLPAKKE